MKELTAATGAGIVIGLGFVGWVIWALSADLVPSPPPSGHILSTGDRVTTEKIGGCEYLLLRGALTHKGDCENPAHHER